MAFYIRKFSEISTNDINIVGGKGANLGVLKSININVPDGFCVTTLAYKEFIKPAEKKIYALAENIDINHLENLRKTAQHIRDVLAENPLPQEITDQIIKAWENLDSDASYAVRSSATAEDLPQASFAGQQDTYLNIIGQSNLLQAVKDCFISLYTDRAVLYRIQNNFNHADVALSVVVQKMLMSESAGIMFTADPISGKRNIVTIDASFGLGEALVSGLVSADLYKVDKQNKQIVSKDIADKKIAIIPVKEGGVETIELDAQRHQQTLSDEIILKLAQLGQQIEAHYKKPQDIEWAIEKGALYITQSRPITSLFPIPNSGVSQPQDNKNIFLSIGHMQVMTDAMPPLSLSMFSAFLPFQMYTAGGRLYANINPILKYSFIRKKFLKGIQIADHLISLALTQWLNTHTNFKNKSHLPIIKTLKFALPFMGQVVNRLFWRKYKNIPHDMNQYTDKYIANFNTTLASKTIQQDKIKYIVEQANSLLDKTVIWKPELMASMLAISLNSMFSKKWATKGDLEALSRGLEGNVNTEMNLAIGDLADVARLSKPLTKHILRDDLQLEEKLKHCTEFEGGEDFLEAWDNFLHLYGARANSEIDIYCPRWHEDQTSLMQIIMGILVSAKKGVHQTHYKQLINDHTIATTRIINAVDQGFFGKLRKVSVKRLIYVIDHLAPLRDHHKFLMVKFMRVSKVHLLETAEHLKIQKKIDNNEDIWFLSLSEIIELLDADKPKFTAKIIERRQAFEHYQKLIPPRLIMSTGEIINAHFESSLSPKGALIGSPISAGIVEGVAKVMTDPRQDTLYKGEILVTPFTDPGWTPLFLNASGLVTEVGGLMTHGSVIAREYGLPAVVGVIDATKKIKTGQRIRVNGDAGYVEILSDKRDETS